MNLNGENYFVNPTPWGPTQPYGMGERPGVPEQGTS